MHAQVMSALRECKLRKLQKGDVGTFQNLYGRAAMSRKLNSVRHSVVVGFLTATLLAWHAALDDWNVILCEKYSSLVRN